jgi:hypothetical protein
MSAPLRRHARLSANGKNSNDNIKIMHWIELAIAIRDDHD